MKVIAMNDKVMEALHASDQAMTDCLEAQRILTELLSDLQELNHDMAEMLGENNV